MLFDASNDSKHKISHYDLRFQVVSHINIASENLCILFQRPFLFNFSKEAQHKINIHPGA